MRTRRLLLLPVLCLSVSGCLEAERVIRLKADGSGTIEDTLVLGQQMKALMAMAAKEAGGGEESKRKAQATAAAMGPGVRVVSEDWSSERMRAVYAFDDIAKIRVETSPGGPDDENAPGAGDQARLAFRFQRRADRSVVTVVQPSPAAPSKTTPDKAQIPEGIAQMAQGMWTMMKDMMKGLRVRTTLVVAGSVLKTNARHADGPTVTLLEMDFDRIAADDANFKKFTSAGSDPSSMDPALLQGIAGMKVNPDAEVVIEFKGQ